jgi:hypothetical protein
MDVRALAVGVLGLFIGNKPLAPLAASIQIPDPPADDDKYLMRAHQVPDPLHPALSAFFDHGSHRFTFVDDNVMDTDRDTIWFMINDSVLSAYFLYGFPGDDRCPPPG